MVQLCHFVLKTVVMGQKLLQPAFYFHSWNLYLMCSHCCDWDCKCISNFRFLLWLDHDFIQFWLRKKLQPGWWLLVCATDVQAEVWNIDVAAKSSDYTDVQLSMDDVRPGRKVIAEHTKVVTSCQLILLVSLILLLAAFFTLILTYCCEGLPGPKKTIKWVIVVVIFFIACCKSHILVNYAVAQLFLWHSRLYHRHHCLHYSSHCQGEPVLACSFTSFFLHFWG